MSVTSSLACRTLVLIVRCDVMELAAIELSLGLVVRGGRVRNISSDVVIFTGSKFIAVVVARVSEHC